MLIETNSYDLSVESYINGSLVKYEDVIHKYSFMKSGTYIYNIHVHYMIWMIEIQERVQEFNRLEQRLLKELIFNDSLLCLFNISQ